MKILSHRGFWLTPDEKNASVAFRRTVDEGFGTETDFRDLVGELVISHDPPTTGALPAEEVIALFAGTGLPLAVNVKADGISDKLAALFSGRDIPWFAFDMSGPETVRYARAGLPFLTRHSDVETQPILYDQALGVWLDAFHDEDWFSDAVIDAHLAAGKLLCIVSSELHGRDPERLWSRLDRHKGQDQIMLCTDIPIRARERFAA